MQYPTAEGYAGAPRPLSRHRPLPAHFVGRLNPGQKSCSPCTNRIVFIFTFWRS